MRERFWVVKRGCQRFQESVWEVPRVTMRDWEVSLIRVNGVVLFIIEPNTFLCLKQSGVLLVFVGVDRMPDISPCVAATSASNSNTHTHTHTHTHTICISKSGLRPNRVVCIVFHFPLNNISLYKGVEMSIANSVSVTSDLR